MPDISLITSLYRSDAHLPTYINTVQNVIAQSDLTVEIIVVANDATPTEQRLLTTFAQQTPHVQVLHCPRETLYASWNRGIAAASSNIIGFWNVDDTRTIEGLQTAYDALTGAYSLVDFAFQVLVQETNTQTTHPPQYRQHNLSPKAGVGPFFMFTRTLYEQAGPFNPLFRITGDFEWSKRDPVRSTGVKRSEVVAGTFTLHGDNLSGGTHPREWVEFNIVLLEHAAYGLLRPADPVLFAEVWQEWGAAAPPSPSPALTWLMGEGAAERFQAYQRYQHAPKWKQRLQTWFARLTRQPTPVQRFQPPVTLDPSTKV